MNEPETIHGKTYAEIVAPYAAAIRMIRGSIEELFGPTANLESEEAQLLRGPEPQHSAEAQIAALQNVAAKLDELQKLAAVGPFPPWQDIEICPKIEDVERLGIWVDIDGVENIVIIRYSASNERHNHGFIGEHGQVYGAGGIIKWMPMPHTPTELAALQGYGKP